MRTVTKYGVFLFVCLLLVAPAAAQTTPATLDYGYTLALPDGWSVADLALTTRSNATILTNGRASLLLLTPPQVAAVYPDAEDADLWDALTRIHLRLYDGVIGAGLDDTWQARYEDSPALMYSYDYELDGQSIRGQTILLDWLPAGGLVFADLTAPVDEFLSAANDLPTFILTLQAAPVTTVDLGGGYVADLPHGWRVLDGAENPRPGTTLLAANDVRLLLLTTPQITARVPDAGTSEYIWNSFVSLHLALYDGLGGDGSVVEIGDEGRMVVRYPYHYFDQNDQLVHALSLFYPSWGADGMVFVDAYGPPYPFGARRAQIGAIARSVRPAP